MKTSYPLILLDMSTHYVHVDLIPFLDTIPDDKIFLK